MKKLILFFIAGVSIACFPVGVIPVGIFGVALTILLYHVWFGKSRKIKKGMTGLEYEHWCAERLIKSGKYRTVTVTPASGDYGADIVAVDRKGNKVVYQCKMYGGKVDNTAVQEAVAAKAHYKADRAGVITNSQLTKKARELAWENAVELMEGFGD